MKVCENIVMVKHPNDNRSYIFRVPAGRELDTGDWVLCETCKSPAEVARCITPSFNVPCTALQSFYGVEQENLKPVVGKLNPVMFHVERERQE